MERVTEVDRTGLPDFGSTRQAAIGRLRNQPSLRQLEGAVLQPVRGRCASLRPACNQGNQSSQRLVRTQNNRKSLICKEV